ncbi:MAG: hypothetical protein U0935_23760 [Pirellulales bacterium]
MVQRLGWNGLACLGTLVLACAAAAQEPPPADDAAAPIMSSASMAFVRRHRTDGWTVVGMNASNPRSTDGEAMLAVFFADEPSRQYARRLWLPPHSRRYDWLPFFIPGRFSDPKDQMTLRTVMIDASGGREVLQRRLGELLSSDMLLARDTDPVKTAGYFRRPTLDAELMSSYQDDDAVATMTLARTSTSLSSNATQLELDFLPPWPHILRTYDNIILTADRIQFDSAGQSAMRGWIRTGGRLWVMLDRVSPETLSLLLGNAVDLQTVDRVELDQYRLESFDAASGEWISEDCEYEVPVELVRVVTSASDVPCRINGWPAAIRVPYGDGEVLITTLAPRGWRAEFQEKPTRALKLLGHRLFQVREGRVTPRVFQTALQDQIGYQIPRRGLAVSLLGSYCLGLLVAGGWLVRTGRLDRLAWVVPAITLVAAATFIGIGLQSSTSVPAMLTHAQLIQFQPQSNEAQIEGLAAVYDQQSRAVTWEGMERSWVVPDPADDASVRRLIWTDRDGTQTQNAAVQAGAVGLAGEWGSRQLAQHIGVRGRFGADGFAGTFTRGELKTTEDPVLVQPAAPALAVRLSGDGHLVAGPDDVLAAGQYTAEALLSDEQRRRQEVLRQLFDPSDTTVFPQSPSLVFWTEPQVAGVTYPEGFAIHGTALGLVPLEIERTDPGTPFRIPSPFLKVQTVAGRVGTSTAYDARTGLWVRGLTRATEVTLRFQLPDQVLPAELTRAVLTIRGNLPSRTLQVLAFEGAGPVTVRELSNLNGVATVELTAAQLPLDARGGVRLALGVGETSKQRGQREQKADQASGLVDPSEDVDNSTWHFDYVRLQVDGRTLGGE